MYAIMWMNLGNITHAYKRPYTTCIYAYKCPERASVTIERKLEIACREVRV